MSNRNAIKVPKPVSPGEQEAIEIDQHGNRVPQEPAKSVASSMRGIDDNRGTEALAGQPPHNAVTRPGAMAISGIRGSDEEQGTVQYSTTQTGTPSQLPVPACVVDTAEDNRMLIEQNRVLQEQNRIIREREEILHQNDKGCWSRRRLLMVVAFLVLIIVALVVVFSIVLTTRESEPSDTDGSTQTSNGTNQNLINLLSSVSSDNGKALQTPGTAQNKALDWLTGNKKLHTYGNMQKIQRFALATLYHSTQGDGWVQKDKWLDNGEECNGWWQNEDPYTLRCDNSGAVDFLHLQKNNLRGSIPAEIGLLSSLIYVGLYHNKLSSPLPSEIGQLTQLTGLSIGAAGLTGTIPTEFGMLTALEWANMHFNSFTGTIPSVIHSMTNLYQLFLGDNQLTGSFTCPDFITDCRISCQESNVTCRSLQN